MPQRIDIGHIQKPVKTDQGYVKVDAFLTRTGVYSYQQPDGTTLKELRSPDEVFHVNATKTLAAIALTNDHPPLMLDSGNTKFFQVGFTGETVEQDGIYLKNRMTITDEETIREVMDERKVAVSCGYHCDVVPEKGNWKGEAYDAVQKNIRYNHVSMVDRARGGSAIKVYLDRMDKGDAVQVEGENIEPQVKIDNNDKGGNPMAVKINVEGIEYEVTERLAEKIVEKDKSIEDSTAKIDELKVTIEDLTKERDEIKGKNDGLEAEKKKLEEAKPDMAAMRKTAKDRNDLEDLTKKLLTEDEVKAVNFDEAEDIDLKKLCIQKVDEKAELKDASEEYVNGMFEIVRKSKKDDKGNDNGTQLKNNLGEVIDKGDEVDIVKLQEAKKKKDSELWKSPVNKKASNE